LFRFYKIICPKKPKLGKKASTCAFLGDSLNSKAYRFFYLVNNTMIETLYAIFYKDKFTLKLKNSGGINLQQNFQPSFELSPSRFENEMILNLEEVKELKLEKNLDLIILCLMFKVILHL
jgi:hypothetical protein